MRVSMDRDCFQIFKLPATIPLFRFARGPIKLWKWPGHEELDTSLFIRQPALLPPIHGSSPPGFVKEIPASLTIYGRGERNIP